MSKQYLFTERTHLMCPNMFFGILVSLRAPLDKNKLEDTVSVLVDAHPFLAALLGYEEESNKYYYDVTSQPQVEILWEDETVNGIYDDLFLRKYEQVISADWNLFEEGMLKIVCWNGDDQTYLLFVFHHLLADGRAGLSLTEEFADHYVDGANRRWKKEKHIVSYELYHDIANRFLKKDRVFHHTDVYDIDQMSEIKALCEKNQVSVNDYLMARMFEEEDTSKIIMACDLRSRLHRL